LYNDASAKRLRKQIFVWWICYQIIFCTQKQSGGKMKSNELTTLIIFHFIVQTHYYEDASAKQHTKPIQKFLGFGKVVLMLEQSSFWINSTRWWTKCTLRRQKVLSWHHFFKEGKITVSPQLTSKNRNSISKALSSLKFPCSFGITLLSHFSAPLSFQLLLLFPIYIVIGVKRDFTVFCTLT